MTSNKDMPAMPQSFSMNEEDCGTPLTHLTGAEEFCGLTKLEHFCLTMGVPDTGDEELDAIIRKGNEQKFAGLAMQGMLASQYYSDFASKYADHTVGIADCAVDHAKALLAQLEEKDCE